MQFWLLVLLGGLVGLFLIGFMIGLGAWLGFGYWQARTDRKTAELYLQAVQLERTTVSSDPVPKP